MMKFLLGVIAATALLLGGFFVGQTYFSYMSAMSALHTTPLAGNFNTTGGGTYNLQATITSSQTTINLSSFIEPQSNIPYTMSYLNSSIEYATIAPQTSQSEFISFTGITQNSDGSATLTGVSRGLDRSYPYTASTTLALPHAGQTRFILSNPPQVYNSYGALANANTWSAVNTFSSTSPPTYDADPVWGNFTTQVFADVAYVNSVVAAGAANASETVKGIVQLATATQLAAGTSIGSTAARLDIPNSLATSTPTAACTTGCVPVAVNGKLSQSFTNLTLTYLWSGLHTFTAGLLATASSTFSATTTIAASSVTNRALVLNTVPYQFPSTQGTNNNTLINNGSGVLSWGQAIANKYSLASTTSSAVANGATITSAFLNIPAGILTASSTITVTADGLSTGTGSNSQFTLQLVDESNNVYFSSGVLTSVTTGNLELEFTGVVMANNSTSAQSFVLNGFGATFSSGTLVNAVSTKGTSAISWTGAKGFAMRLICGSQSGQTCTFNNFIMTVTP